MTAADPAMMERLLSILDAELACYQQLTTAVDTQYRALLSGDVLAVAAATEEQARLAEQAAELARQRVTLAGERTLEELAACAGMAGSTLRERRGQLLEVAEHLQRRTERNRAILGTLVAFTRERIQVLTRDDTLYQENGQTRARSVRGVIDRRA